MYNLIFFKYNLVVFTSAIKKNILHPKALLSFCKIHDTSILKVLKFHFDLKSNQIKRNDF